MKLIKFINTLKAIDDKYEDYEVFLEFPARYKALEDAERVKIDKYVLDIIGVNDMFIIDKEEKKVIILVE